MTFEMMCSCGDAFKVEAETRAEAVSKIQEMMGPDAVKKHFADKHQGENIPPMDQVKSMIEQQTKQVL